MKIWLVIAETLGTDGEYYTEVYVEKSGQRAGEFASALVADMCETMGVEGIDPTETWEVDGGEWFYRVRVREEKI